MNQSRNIGLDIVRSTAIIFVLACHSTFFLVDVDATFLVYLGVLSVEIFFVLSGFLIGKSMMGSMVEENSALSLKKFYLGRCLRTLPLYYLLLIVTALIKKQQIPLSCILFVQNFNEVDLNFLPVSWSLSIEEWFYFLVPLFLFFAMKLFSKRFKKKNIFFVVSIILCVIPFVLRVHSVVSNKLPWDFSVRKQIFLRLDSIMMGVILAGIKNYATDIYNKISRSKICLAFSLGGLVLLGILYSTYLGRGDYMDKSIFWKIGLFSILPLLSCFLIMYMENSESINNRLKGKTISKYIYELSVLSYGLYLIHWNIFEQVSVHYKGLVALAICVIVSIIISKIVYHLIEIPIMRLKKNIVQKMK